MIFDHQARPESRPDKKLLQKLASKRRAAVAAAVDVVAKPTRKKAESRAKSSGFSTKLRTCPGMGVNVAPKAREEVFVNPWDERRPVLPLPALRAKTPRPARGTRVQSPGKKRSHEFSAAELNFFSVGEELADAAPPQEEPPLRWWQRLTRLPRES